MIVLDSSFLIAFHNTRDVHHAAAARSMLRLLAGEWGRAALLEYVFLEVVTVLVVRRGLDAATTVAKRLLEAGDVDFTACSDLFSQTLTTFSNQAGTRLSLTDAAIVALARGQGGAFVATFDRDFQGLEGITVVPR